MPAVTSDPETFSSPISWPHPNSQLAAVPWLGPPHVEADFLPCRSGGCAAAGVVAGWRISGRDRQSGGAVGLGDAAMAARRLVLARPGVHQGRVLESLQQVNEVSRTEPSRQLSAQCQLHRRALWV